MLNIGDMIRVAFGNPLDAVAAALIREDALAEQVRPPTDNEQAEIEKVAAEAAALQDELAVHNEAFDKLRALKKDLTGRMIQHGMKELKIDGRLAIELTDTNSRKPTRKAIVSAMQKAYVEKLGEKEGMKEGKTRAFALWAALEPTIGHKLTIPAPVPEIGDVEPNY